MDAAFAFTSQLPPPWRRRRRRNYRLSIQAIGPPKVGRGSPLDRDRANTRGGGGLEGGGGQNAQPCSNMISGGREGGRGRRADHATTPHARTHTAEQINA